MSQAKYSLGSCLFFSLAFFRHGWKNQIAIAVCYLHNVECPVGASRQDEQPVAWPRVQGLCGGPAELTLDESWRVLAQPSDGVEPQQTQRIGFLQDLAAGDLAQCACSVFTGVIGQWPGRGNYLLVNTVAEAACELLSTTLTCLLDTLAQHRDSCPVPGCSMRRESRLARLPNVIVKVWKGWEIGQRVRQGILIFPLPQMLKELQRANHCDSSDLKILRSLCPMPQYYR